MDHSKGLVWKRSVSVSDSDDVWDDRALIDAYDKAVKEVNKRIADKSAESNDKGINSGCGVGAVTGDKPNEGKYCRCVYSEDGIEYEAQIISINASNETCSVKYIGYGNEEQKSLKELKPSLGKRYRNMQQMDAQKGMNSGSDNDCDNSATNESPFTQSKHKPIQSDKTSNTTPEWFMPSGSHSEHIIPPHFPSALESTLPSDDESLASMLMSWYMSGYHTGYYRALKQCRHLCNK